MKHFEDQWERLRNKGKLKYILIQGLLLWGIPMAVISTLYLHYRGGIPFKPMVYYTVPIFLCGGLLFGLLMWMFLENRYNKHKHKHRS